MRSPPGLVETFDPYPRFRDQLASIVDLERIRAADRRVLVENLYGSGAGWYTRLIGDGRLTVRELHTERNPFFGGVNPEPIRPNIDEWLEEIPRWGAEIGIAFDGDADRVGMATEEGVFVNQLQVYGLLYWYLLEVRGQIGPAVYTVTTTSMAKRLAEIYGTQAYETGVGFKYVGPKMTETNAVIGGEESGGFGFGMHIPERDGLASGLFLLDLWLTKGKKASEVLAELQALAGPSYYNRIDIRFAREGYERVKTDTLARLAAEAPTELAGREVVERVELETRDGFKFYRDDGSWLLIRFSGTEALLRVYVEARSPEDVEALLAEGRRIAAAEQPRAAPPADGRPRLLRLQEPRRGARAPDPAEEGDDERPPLFEEAVTLDDPATLRRIDPEDMLGKVAEMPRQLAQARVWPAFAPDARLRDVDAVIVLAMGGSAIGAELVAAAAGDRLRVPLIVHRDYGLPAGAGPRTLIVAASHSGETAETLSGFGEALRRELPLVAVTTGGRLAAQATEAGVPVLRYRPGGQPRAAIGYGVGLVHELLERLALVAEPDPIGPAVAALESLLERLAPSVQTDANPAKQLAWSMFGRIPVIYGHGRMAAAAHRWKTQLNENAKAWAAWEPMPEANHNAIEGAQPPRAVGRPVRRRASRSRRAGRDRRALPRRRGAAGRARHEPLGGVGRGPVAAGAGALRGRLRRHGELLSRDPLPDRPDPGYTAGDAQGAARQGHRIQPDERQVSRAPGGSGAMEVPATCIRA